MNSNWTRRLVIFAAAWNLIGGATSLADPAGHFAAMYTVAVPAGDPLLMYFYRCTWINVLAWGGAYLLAAFAPSSRRAVLIAGGLGKAAYFLACAALVASGVGKPLVLVFGLSDLAMAVLFGWAVVSVAQAERRQSQGTDASDDRCDGLATKSGSDPDFRLPRETPYNRLRLAAFERCAS